MGSFKGAQGHRKACFYFWKHPVRDRECNKKEQHVARSLSKPNGQRRLVLGVLFSSCNEPDVPNVELSGSQFPSRRRSHAF